MWNLLKSIFAPKALVKDLEQLLNIIGNTPASELVAIVQEANQIVGGRQQVNVNSLGIIIQVVKAVAKVIENKK
jgi:hypothetical protein